MDYNKFSTHEEEISMFFEEYCKSFDVANTEILFSAVRKPDIRKDDLDLFSDDLRNAYFISDHLFNRDVPKEPDYDGDEIAYEDEMYHYEQYAEEYAFDVKDTVDQLYSVLNGLDSGVKMVDRYTTGAVSWLFEKGMLLKTFYANLSKFRHHDHVYRVYELLKNDFDLDGIDDTIQAYVKAIENADRKLKLQVEYVERYTEEILEDMNMVKSKDSSFMEMRHETAFGQYTMELEDVMNFGNKLNDRLLAYLYIVDRDTELFVGNLVKR